MDENDIPEVNQYDKLRELMDRHSLLTLFVHLTWRQKIAKVVRGLRSPHDSGDYKYARLQIARLAAPVCAFLVPLMGVVALLYIEAITPPREREVQVEVIDPESIEDLDELEDLEDEPIEPPEPIDFNPDVVIDTEVIDVMNAPATEMTPQPAAFDTVAMVKSPVIMRGIVGNRGAGRRGKAIVEFGGSGITEGAVLRALRWLKMNQLDDGSWPERSPSAMAAMGLLTFLAHGETPDSEEFGVTVEKAIKYLVSAAGSQQRYGGNYEIPICTYAICEAYALTRVPMLKPIAENSIDFIIKGQHPTGGWDYSCGGMRKAAPGKEAEDPWHNKYRDDTSYMGWCVQALKAAKMAGLEHPQLDSAMTLAIKGFQQNSHPNGGFGYTGPGQGGLSGIGVLCMQFLGAARDPVCRKGIALLEAATFKWDEPWGGSSPVYYWYYVTQAKFHHGGGTWNKWNDKFSRELVRTQTIEKGVYPGGKDVGYWDSPSESEHHDGRVMDTCLSTLQLEVYYRYLPTFKPPKQLDYEDEFVSDLDEIEIEINI